MIIPFPVLTLGELESPRGWSAALNLPLPLNPSIALIDAAIRELLDFQCSILSDKRILWIEEEELSNQISRRLSELHGEATRWHRRQKIRLGVGI